MTTEYQPMPELNELIAAAAEGALDEDGAARLNARWTGMQHLKQFRLIVFSANLAPQKSNLFALQRASNEYFLA